MNDLKFATKWSGSARRQRCPFGARGAFSATTRKRSGAWLKYKCALREWFAIGGYLPIRTTGVGIGALLLGYHDAEKRLQFAGRVGSGFTNKAIKELL